MFQSMGYAAGRPILKIDCDAFFFPVAKTCRLGTARAAVLGFALGVGKIDSATFGSFHQGAAGGFADGALTRGVWNVFVEGGFFFIMVMMVVAVVVAAAGGGGMFGHRDTVLRASV